MDKNLNIYDPIYLAKLFDEMASTYGVVNLVTSFGLTVLWRKYCVRNLPSQKVKNCCDLMSGMGELLHDITCRYTSLDSITAIDICPSMCENISKNTSSYNSTLNVLQEDIFNSSIEDESFDCVVSSFGLKTFSLEQQEELAKVIKRILKPGGIFSLIELSLPKYAILRLPLVFYLRYIVPQVGRFFLGNPDNYRMLGVYTERFRNSDHFYNSLVSQGFEVSKVSHFFGCATGVIGRKVLDHTASF
jgi:ubiquinone/menaquinone biosynthesis methyltransferase